MILIEQLIEQDVRTAIRKNLEVQARSVPELAEAKIICFWNAAENANAEELASDMRVEIAAYPNNSIGYNPGIGLLPHRTIRLSVTCINNPESDTDSRIFNALYIATRGAFETLDFIEWNAAFDFHALQILSPGTPSYDELGKVVNFEVIIEVTMKE